MPQRSPAVAGHFYEGNPAVLARQVDAWLNPAAPLPIDPEMLALLPSCVADADSGEPVPALLTMLPHAGHIFCGAVIGKTLSRTLLPRRLVLLCPNHTGLGRGLAVWPSGLWNTPLGDVPVDEELADALADCDAGFVRDTAAHMREHALEVQLPFLQRRIPELRIAPVCVHVMPSALEPAGTALAGIIRKFREQGEDVGIVVSSDMNHYAPREETLRRDSGALAAFLAADPVGLYNTVHRGGISMCGVCPATLALFAARTLNATSAALTGYTTSGKATGDESAVVGYAGAYLER